MQLVCPSCGTRNRVPDQRLADAPICGRCSTELMAAKPVALADERFAGLPGWAFAPWYTEYRGQRVHHVDEGPRGDTTLENAQLTRWQQEVMQIVHDDGRVVRVPIPQLTEERRKMIAKQLGDKAEDTRIAMRNIRQDALKDAKRKKDDKELSEDDVKRVEKEIDKLMNDFQGKIDESFKAKEKDILTI